MTTSSRLLALRLVRPIAVTAFLATALVHLPAQTSTAAHAGDEAIHLDRYEVTGLPVERSVNPLVRPIGGVFGDDRSILDTPRSVSSITPAMLRERGIDGVREYVPFAPGTQAAASYGKTTIPFIRGDLAETFQNGQRLSYNNFGYAPSFNSVEAIEIVRGPGSAAYGSGFFTGGYVNYIAKVPKFTREGTATLRLGSWVPGGGSWLNASWQLDEALPSTDGKSAWRVSYDGREDSTFFRRHGGRDDREDIYIAWRRQAGDSLTIDANAQLIWQASPQLLGVNRPNQELIDSGRYYTGDLPDLGYSAAGAIDGVIPGNRWVDLPRDATLLSPGDFSNAVVARGQLIVTAALAGGAQLVNRSLFEHVNRRRWHAFEYGEYAGQWTAENRTEWRNAVELAGRTHRLLAGLAMRWEDRLSFTNYFNEYFFQYDLTRANPVFSHAADYPNSYWPGFTGPGGRLFFPAEYGSPETSDSKLWNPALFLQDEVELGNRVSLLAGWRGDGFVARARDPLGAQAGGNWHDKHAALGNSWNASLTWRPTERTSFYATAQRAVAVRGNVTGGGIMLKDDGTGAGVIDGNDFTNASRMLEVGAKYALAENRLYLGLAGFDQRRTEVAPGGGIDRLRVRGAELELVYQPHSRLNATLNLALNDARLVDTAPFQAGGASLYNLYAAGRGPGGLGNGAGFQWDAVPAGNYRVPGISRWVVNGSFSWQATSGWGGGLGGSWQGEQPGNLTNEYHLPAQVFLNAFLFYRQPRWEANLDVLNVLDRRNWIHNGDNWSNHVLIFQDLPLRLEGYVKFRF